jgi:anti-sigma B factor antagonist
VADVGVAGSGDVVVLVASGELDYGVTPRLRACLLAHVKAGCRRLLLDLSSVTFIDSTAIGVLMSTVAALRDAGNGSLAVVCADENERVLRIFDIAAVASVIALYRSCEAAFSALALTGSSGVSSWVEDAGASTSASDAVAGLRCLTRVSELYAARRYELDACTAQDRLDGAGAGVGEVDELA